MENAYIYTEDDMTINSAGHLVMNDASLASVEDLIIYGDVTGSGNKNAVKIDDYSGVYNSATISGAVDLCDAAGGLNYNYGNYVNGATHNCSVYIPTSTCNPEGVGSTPPDTDNDGVPDSQDEFPNDPNKAFISYYPSPTVFGTHVFEDLWPSMGDYDFNDLVMRYQYAIISNADNDAVEIEATYHVAALGAGYKNGFGISIESITNNDIASVSGIEKLGSSVSYNSNNTEAGHSGEAVIIIVDDLNAFSGGYDYVNVEPQGFALAMDTMNVTIELAAPTSQLNIGAAPFNPFIFVNQVRGKEVHLMNYANTDLADLSYFRTQNDASTPTIGSYYHTINNFPWAIDIPGQFDYMIEQEDLVDGHLYFSQWAQRGGTLYTDWYLDLPGYRNNSKIY
jgi:LruC domain-containing protein